MMPIPAMITLGPLGDRAFLAKFATEAEASAWASALRRSPPPAVVDVVLAYRAVAIFLAEDFDDVEAVERLLIQPRPCPTSAIGATVHHIPVLYDGEDLPEVASRTGLDVASVVALHSGCEYAVMAVGFLPGFPYAGPLPGRLAGLARRDSPRVRVPRGSVAIAGRQTAIYPAESPGGWHLLGRTPLRIADVEAGHFPIVAGDRLRFFPVDPGEYSARRDEWLASGRHSTLDPARIAPL